MKNIKYSLLLLAFLLLLFTPGVALAQDYYFSLPKAVVNVYWNEDGSVSVDYVFVFNNLAGSPSIQFVDVGVKNPYFDVNSISADVDGKPVYNFSTSDFQGEGGSGVAVGLGSHSIPPGKTSIVHVFIGTVNRVLYPDDQDANYASAVYAPSWFGSKYVQGTTDLTVTFHLPPGVKPEEPRWHAAPDNFPSEPVAGIDDQGRITYTWHNPQASSAAVYTFGASFPKQYVPASAVVHKSLLETLGISADTLITLTLCSGFFGFVVLMIVVGSRSAQRRRLQYLPPKISIEGHGIKRGLTAVEAAILLEEPLDKILTMILFAVVKKGAATVTSRDPLELTVTQPQPDGLQPYETKFLEAFQQKEKLARRKVMQELMVDLVQAVAQKMKGFSRRETVAYYRDIMTRAWAEVETANTPEVKSQKYDEVMEWTMLDRDYDQRTRRVFGGGPVFVPIWWPRYDPGFGRGGAGMPVSTSTGGGGSGGGGISMPTLPGSAFAASVVTGPQHFAQSVIGNVTDFTGAITNKTNPPPPPPASSSTRRVERGWWSRLRLCVCLCWLCLRLRRWRPLVGLVSFIRILVAKKKKIGENPMKPIKYGIPILVLLLLLFSASQALAQSYYFSVPNEVVNIYWNEDGSASVDYVFDFNNSDGGSSIEYVDVGVKNSNFNVNNITADVDGNSISNFSTSDFQGVGGSGVAVGLGSHSIKPGKTGVVHVFIDKISQVLYPDSQDANYASAVYAPSYFGSQYVHGATDLTVTFHLPPGVKPEEPRWHAAPDNFPSEPVTGIDNQGRGTYTWHNPQGSAAAYYEFGASFPKSYVPGSAIIQSVPNQPPVVNSISSSNSSSSRINIPFPLILFIVIILFRFLSSFSPVSKTRRLEYLPPKISIEGHGIKRGLTAVEAAILLEEPLDKILTMILFAVVKKGAATVTSPDPLELQITQPQPEGLQPYEIKFLKAFQNKEKHLRLEGLQEMMVDLVQAVTQKMKGFSSSETVAYYRDIMRRAWSEVEAANTPEVKSQKYDEVMEWTMLDRDYDQRTRRVFQDGPVFVPIWWPRFDPGFGRGASGMPVSTSTGGGGISMGVPSVGSNKGGGGISMPTLPGSAFAASVVTGPQHFAQSVIGNVTDFTSAITNKTNPPPPPSSRGGWGGGGGCACACAGCACACAGGGR